MNFSKHKFELELEGRTLTIETGLLAEQANASVLARLGDTVVLVTAVLGKNPREGIGFLPLMVDYEERFYAAGRILGSRFMKRESRPSEEAILSGRLIDRAVRPLFDQTIRNDIQLVVTVLSADGQNDPDILALIGASCALMISDIPWNGPVGAVRVGLKNGTVFINPTYEERIDSDAEIVVAGPLGLVNMMEAQTKEIPEAKAIELIGKAGPYIEKIIAFQNEIAKKIGVQKTDQVQRDIIPDDFKNKVEEFLKGKVEPAIYTTSKVDRNKNMDELTHSLHEWLISEGLNEKQHKNWAEAVLDEEVSNVTHKNILEHGKRPDGRKLNELRSLDAFVGVLPRTHGSGLFIRGNTQALTSLTLGSPGDEQTIEGMEIQTQKRFMHHYNFPPFSVGEIGHMRGPGRREIGHGALAENALLPLIPPKEKFPYTIRLVSEILSSNGSSSMASVCGSILALMDGGVPIKAPAAGIAMGMMSEGDKFSVLTDIQGPEDHHGDMDLKVAGTSEGITALQMDVKLHGVSVAILERALAQAREARMEILSVLQKTISEVRPNLSPLAPRIFTIQINPEKIGSIIGPQGKTINEITKTTGVSIDIEDSGLVFITAPSQEAGDKAFAWVNDLTRELKAGEEFVGRVVRMVDFGAFIELVPGQDGLLHVSEFIPGYRVENPSQILKLGQEVRVKIQEIDDQGRVNLELANPEEFVVFKDTLGVMKPQGSGFGRGDGGNSRGPRGRFRR